ncbi:MAG: class I SAM-dependent methyltransferase [Patescibacteria group bacterium]|jgi:16S rRNA A1518/A1519 N6-dimethyltransferase RsmA/KsgA/DIM1 with predicted DNA glycosylase/AP lyase activity
MEVWYNGFIVFSILISLALLLLALLILGWVLYFRIFHRGAVYFPSSDRTVKTMIDLANVSEKDTVVDLGSGDGRILVAAAQKGAKAIGYEINPFLVWQSRKHIEKLGFSHLVQVKFESFWKADFSKASVVILYQFPSYMKRLQKLIQTKTSHPLIVISNRYEFPEKKWVKKSGKVYVYLFD